MGTIQGNGDQGSGYFQHYGSASGVLAALPGLFPSVGCIVYTRPDSVTQFFDAFTLSPQHDFVGLDGGPALSVTGPLGAKQLLRGNTGTASSPDFRYKVDLAGDPPLSTSGPPYLVPGAYTVTGSGGVDVGAFSANVTVPSIAGNPWTNQDAVMNISRSQDLTLTINPSGNNLPMAVLGDSYDPALGWYGIFNCTVPPGATSFTIPSYVLAALPPSGLSSDLGGVRTAFLGVGVGSIGARVQTRGVDAGLAAWFQVFAKNVNFQ
jgi:hypothetical protein